MFSHIEYSNFYLKGTKPAQLYGTPKIHKTFLPGSLPPFQPIVSSISTYNYNLAQYLGSHLNTPKKTVLRLFKSQIGKCGR